MTWTGTTAVNDRPPSHDPESQAPKPSFSAADITTLSYLGQQWKLPACETGDYRRWASNLMRFRSGQGVARLTNVRNATRLKTKQAYQRITYHDCNRQI